MKGCVSAAHCRIFKNTQIIIQPCSPWLQGSPSQEAHRELTGGHTKNSNCPDTWPSLFQSSPSPCSLTREPQGHRSPWGRSSSPGGLLFQSAGIFYHSGPTRVSQLSVLKTATVSQNHKEARTQSMYSAVKRTQAKKHSVTDVLDTGGKATFLNPIRNWKQYFEGQRWRSEAALV